jgi:hypothetical protein
MARGKKLDRAYAQADKLFHVIEAEGAKLEPKLPLSEVMDLIDRDRIKQFLTFVRNMPPGSELVFGTADQVRSIAGALVKAGY